MRTRGLSRRFGARTALRDLELDVGAGAIVGIAGPNGAGKSTLLQILAGLLRPTAGDALVFGLDPWRERAAIMRRARFAFSPPGLFASLTAREHLRALGGLGAARPERADVEECLEQVGLAARADDAVGTYSFGMRQRLALALALLPRPELLVLDEPAEGLDPRAVLELRAILQRLRVEYGVTVILSSHLLLELDALVDHLVVLDQGEVLCQGAPRTLRGPPRVRIRTSDGARAAATLAAGGLVAEQDARGDLWLASGSSPGLEDVRTVLAAAGVALVEFAQERPSLESALLARLGSRPAAC